MARRMPTIRRAGAAQRKHRRNLGPATVSIEFDAGH